jgi:uncharacterized protein (DUF58 family)
MPSGRGAVVFVAGLAMWLVARIIGSPGLSVIGVGLAVLPFAAAAFARWGRQRLVVRRHLSEVRVSPGTRVTVELEVENRSGAATSFLLIEDRLPAGLGRSARLVLTGIPARNTQRVTYSLVPQSRGRYRLGPVELDVSDPFALTRVRVEYDERDDLLVTPEIEDLIGESGSPYGTNIGVSRAKQLFRTGEEFYTMRPYQQGDDLRRLHWPSVARTGEMMIRQDESSRRSGAVVFLDTRLGGIGKTFTPSFEKAVSAAASVGRLLVSHGFTLQLATADSTPVPLTEEGFLDALTAVGHSSARSIGPALTRLRSAASPDTTLVAIAAPPVPSELSSLIRTGTAFGPKLAVLVYPIDPDTLPPERAAQLEGRASQARLSLTRSGWDVLVCPPSARLKDLWNASRDRRPALSV